MKVCEILIFLLLTESVLCLHHPLDLKYDSKFGEVEIGQVGGLAVNSNGEVHIFHRGENIWNSMSFTADNVYTLKYFPIEVDAMVILNRNGTLKRSFGNNTYYLPHGLTLDFDGNMWLTDVALHQVFRIPRNATLPDLTLGYRFEPGSDIDHFCKPTDVAVLSNGEFFIGDGYCNSRIMKFDKYGYFMKQWGTKSVFKNSDGFPPPGSFNFPHALTLAEDKHKLCVADRENGRIQCFDLDGNFVNQMHPKLFGRTLYAIEYSQSHGGVLFAVNGPRNSPDDTETQGFTLDINTGNLLSTWNIPGAGLTHPHDVAVDEKNHMVYVGELNPQQTWKFYMPQELYSPKDDRNKLELIVVLVTIPVIVLILILVILWLQHTGRLHVATKSKKPVLVAKDYGIDAEVADSGLDISQYSVTYSQTKECIKPVKVDRTAGKVGKIRIEDDGSYFNIAEGGTETRLQKAQITLNDCLACSGCITSAESVLITQQSQDELYRILQENLQLQKDGQADKQKTVVVSVSQQALASLAAKYNLSMTESAHKLTAFMKKLGVHYVLDTAFARGFSLIESCREFVNRYTESETYPAAFPMLASACPGWICYAEKTHGSYILPYISTVKSPQQIMGSIVKDYFAKRLSKSPDTIYHVSVMPCFDKKLEASRPDFYSDVYSTRDVDCVITSGEVDLMLQKEGTSLADIEDQVLDNLFGSAEFISHIGGGSGGYLEHVARYAAEHILGVTLDSLKYKTLRNQDFQEVTIETEGKPPIKMALAYGFRNIQNIVQKIKRGKCQYHFVEIMACPSGCVNGGGQIKPEGEVTVKDRLAAVTELYNSVKTVNPWSQSDIQSLYDVWLGGKDSEKCRKMLHTQYHEVEKMTNALAIKW